MDAAAESVLEKIMRAAPTLHQAGTFSRTTLEAFIRHATARPVHRSAETGSGASTLLLSHISEHHTVFALDAGTGSVRAIQASPLLNQDVVTFVEGPTQLTLPAHTFDEPLQLVLIDGPHAYPFPDLEYYHLYPHLETGALLIVDDIHIPTITNLFEFLSADDMFHLEDVVENTAFFRRTTAETFSPVGDGWFTQRYNLRRFEAIDAELQSGPPPDPIEGTMPSYIDQIGSTKNPASGTIGSEKAGEALRVIGWALDVHRRGPATAVDLVLDGQTYRAAIRFPRADVATAYNDRNYLMAGFYTRLPAAALTPGSHDLEIRVVLSGGRDYYSALRVRFDAV
jgi:predicted O-methyltransferase YrrM